MLKFYWSRDWMNKDNPRRITGLIIKYGCSCRLGYCCNKRSECKYASRGRWNTKRHNSRVSFNLWTERNFGFKFPWMIYIDVNSADLSGTDMCPFNKCRHLTCWDCIHNVGEVDGECTISYFDRNPISEDTEYYKDWGPHGRCGDFIPNDYSMKYNKHTGELII